MFLGFKGWLDYNTFIMQSCWSNYNFVGVEVASHENDHGEIRSNHAMKNVDWVHKGSRWVCKINGCIDNYVTKQLLHCHLDNKHMLHLEVGKYGRPSTHLGEPRQQNHSFMNVHILNNPHARQK
jgi:hypothetical protein